MSAPDQRPDNRSTAVRAAERIAAARAHLPATDNNGHPLPDQPRPVFRYGPDQLLDGVDTTEPDEPAQP